VDGFIQLTGITVFAHHGVLGDEQREGQAFVVDVRVELDLGLAAATDELASTLDYAALAQAVHDRVAGERWNLIERVADRVADLVLADQRVRGVEVTVHKPEAPIAVAVDDVAVSIRRSR
jgi:dihydroneopterin aldolase